MDGFYLVFIVVGAGLFWISLRQEGEAPDSLKFAWALLAVALASGVVMVSGDPRSLLVFEGLGSFFLGGAVACTGLALGQMRRQARKAASRAAAQAEALSSLTPPSQSPGNP